MCIRDRLGSTIFAQTGGQSQTPRWPRVLTTKRLSPPGWQIRSRERTFAVSFHRVIGEENKKEIVSCYQSPPFARDETSFSIKKRAKWGRNCARTSEEIQRRPIVFVERAQGVRIDKSKRPRKKYIIPTRECESKMGHTHHSLFSQSFLVRLPHFLALGADRFRVRALLHGCDYRVCFYVVHGRVSVAEKK